MFLTVQINAVEMVNDLLLEAHIQMMSLLNLYFRSISKTINIPNEANVNDFKEAYLKSWLKGLKCNALYRDGSKLSQPLNVNVDKYIWDEEDSDLEIENSQPAQVRIAEKIIHRYIAKRRRLPHRRKGYTQKPLLEDTRFICVLANMRTVQLEKYLLTCIRRESHLGV